MSMYVHVCMPVGGAECIYLFICWCVEKEFSLLRKYARLPLCDYSLPFNSFSPLNYIIFLQFPQI